MQNAKNFIFIIFIIFLNFQFTYSLQNIDPEKGLKLEIPQLEKQKETAKNNQELADINFRLAQAYLFYPNRDVLKAMELLEETLKLNPEGKYADDAAFILGYIYRKEKKDSANALKYFEKVLKEFPTAGDNTEYFYDDIYNTRDKTTWNDDAQYNLGLTYKFLIKDIALAQENFKKVIDNYPSSPYANDSLYEIALINEEKGDFNEAYSIYQQLCNEYPFGSADSYYRGNLSASLLAKQKIEALKIEHNTPIFEVKDIPSISPEKDLALNLLSNDTISEGENIKFLFEISNKSNYPIILGSAYSIEEIDTPSFWSRWTSTEYNLSWLNTRTGELRYNESKRRMEEFPVIKHLSPTWYPYTSGLLLPGQSKRFSIRQYINKDGKIKLSLSYLPITFAKLAKCSVSQAITEKISDFTAGMNIGAAVGYGHPLPEEIEQGRHEALIISIGALPDFFEYEFNFTAKVIKQEFSLNKAIEAIGNIEPTNLLYSKKLSAWVLSKDKNLWIVKKDNIEKLSNISIYVFEYLEGNNKPIFFIKNEAQNVNKYPIIEKIANTYPSEKKGSFLAINVEMDKIISVLKDISQSGLNITVDSWYLNPIILVTD